jgi:phosphatidylserine/phosphatidylglycerophosphate/cardiolipin synthase-like enzyme
MELLSSPFRPHFDQFIDRAERSCLICSPYITMGPVEKLVEKAAQKGLEESLTLRVITDISARNLLNGSTDIAALLLLTQRIRNSDIVYLPRIHAKVYIAGESLAIVSSANFTEGGFWGNLEYGVRVTDASSVQTIRGDVEDYSRLGGGVTTARLGELAERVVQLRGAVQREQRSIDEKLRLLSAELRRATEDELVRVHVSGRSAHAIFAETVLFLLARRNMTTAELHHHIQDIHPDLCDDTTDRVIDGHHFGKLWKHQVRTSQQHLKKKGLVAYDSGDQTWRLLP